MCRYIYIYIYWQQALLVHVFSVSRCRKEACFRYYHFKGWLEISGSSPFFFCAVTAPFSAFRASHILSSSCRHSHSLSLLQNFPLPSSGFETFHSPSSGFRTFHPSLLRLQNLCHHHNKHIPLLLHLLSPNYRSEHLDAACRDLGSSF